ncbi:MAG: response regulator transcription factor [Chloroflexota bacterium]|nr:MAG: response regulator transcription factor [Chloroflexota bacterium]UCF29443.1 MAG: response regulator transcription factor [Chloroflexota bacterium]
METIRIVVVDDHPLFRQGVVDTISLEPDFIVIGEATSGEEALDLIRNLSPDIAIVDVNLPGINGQQVTQHVVNEKLPTRIMLLTAYDDSEQKLHAMKVGAAAYCVKDVQPETLAENVRQVIKGKFVIGDEVLDTEELETWLEPESEADHSFYSELGDPYEPLSKREMEVLAQLTKGMSNKEIANELGISHQTVKNHVTSILRKLGVEDRTQATLYALKRGWVRLQDDDKEIQ